MMDHYRVFTDNHLGVYLTPAVFLKMLKCVRYCWMVSTGDQVSEPLVMMWLGAVLGTQLPRKPCINSWRIPQQLLATTQGQYSTSTRIPLKTLPTVTLPSLTMKSPISNLGPLLSMVCFFL